MSETWRTHHAVTPSCKMPVIKRTRSLAALSCRPLFPPTQPFAQRGSGGSGTVRAFAPRLDRGRRDCDRHVLPCGIRRGEGCANWVSISKKALVLHLGFGYLGCSE